MTTADYLEQLQQDKSDLVDNLTEMGIEDLTGDETFTELVPEVLNISGGGSSKYAPRYISFVNYQGTELNNELENLDTSNITDMQSMFGYCPSLINVNLSNWNTRNVTNMNSMFLSDSVINTITFGDNFNTSNVTTMQNMFNACSALTTLNLSSFNTSNVTNMNSMFYNCRKLETITFGEDFELPLATNMSQMFTSCTRLDNNTLNAILHICTTATSLSSSNKTLKYIGLTSAQATTCQGLSNWQEFVDAGWTTGY